MNIRRCSGIIKPRQAWYLATEKEITTLVVLGSPNLHTSGCEPLDLTADPNFGVQ
jgi:hypothetical protein